MKIIQIYSITAVVIAVLSLIVFGIYTSWQASSALFFIILANNLGRDAR